MKNQAFDLAGDVLEVAEEYWNQHKEELIKKGLQIALRV